MLIRFGATQVTIAKSPLYPTEAVERRSTLSPLCNGKRLWDRIWWGVPVEAFSRFGNFFFEHCLMRSFFWDRCLSSKVSSSCCCCSSNASSLDVSLSTVELGMEVVMTFKEVLFLLKYVSLNLMLCQKNWALPWTPSNLLFWWNFSVGLWISNYPLFLF